LFTPTPKFGVGVNRLPFYRAYRARQKGGQKTKSETKSD